MLYCQITSSAADAPHFFALHTRSQGKQAGPACARWGPIRANKEEGKTSITRPDWPQGWVSRLASYMHVLAGIKGQGSDGTSGSTVAVTGAVAVAGTRLRLCFASGYLSVLPCTTVEGRVDAASSSDGHEAVD